MVLFSCITEVKYIEEIILNYKDFTQEIVVYTNNRSLVDFSTKNIEVKYINFKGSNFAFTRYIKMFGSEIHSSFPSIYFDSTVNLTYWLSSRHVNLPSEACFFAHPKRSSAFSEVLYNYLVGKESISSLIKFGFYASRHGLGNSLVLGGIIFLASKTDMKYMQEWHHHYKALGLKRDQPSLCYVENRLILPLPPEVVVGRNEFIPNRLVRLYTVIKSWIKS